MLVIFSVDEEFALRASRPARAPRALVLGNDLGHRFLVPGDDDLAARAKLFNQFYEVRFSFLNGDG
jgi:hypothetical protein